MTFCEEVRRETDIYWKGSLEHLVYQKRCYNEWAFWETAMTKQSWITEGLNNV